MKLQEKLAIGLEAAERRQHEEMVATLPCCTFEVRSSEDELGGRYMAGSVVYSTHRKFERAVASVERLGKGFIRRSSDGAEYHPSIGVWIDADGQEV